MMTVLDLERYQDQMKRLNAPLIGRMKNHIKKKIELINSIEEKGVEMSQKQFNYVQAETRFLDDLLRMMEMQEEVLDNIVYNTKLVHKNYYEYIMNGANLRQKIIDQQMYIDAINKQNQQLIDLLLWTKK